MSKEGTELTRQKTLEKTSANISESKAEHVGALKVNRPHIDATYVGWKQLGGWEEKDELTPEDDLMDMSKETILDNIIPDTLYGDWYHSVGIFALGGILSFAIGKFHFSFAPAFFVVLITGLLYRTSIKKYRGSIRDLVQKEMTVQRVEDDYETLEWLNTLLDKYWPIIEPNASQMVVQQVNEIIRTNPSIPTFIKALWIDKFTLGIKPPRVDRVKTFQNTASDVVVMDWSLSFTPHDLSDMNAKQVRNYVNQGVVIKANIFGFVIPVSVSDVSFKADARLRFKLMTPFPHMETVNIQLLEVPDIDFVASLFGNSLFNMEILAIPGLLPLIHRMASKYMGPMLLPPFSLQLNIPQLISSSALSIGVLEVTIKNVKDIKRSSSMLNISIDPYLAFEFGGKRIAKTRTVRDTLNPVWNETMYILLQSFTDPLTISLYDKRAKLKDKVLGRIEYNLNSLHDNDSQRNVHANFLRNSKPIGEMNFDLRFFPTLVAKRLPSGVVEELPDLNTGISKIVVEEVRIVQDEPDKKVNAYVELYVNAKLVLTTKKATSDEDTIKWSQDYEAVIMDRRKTRCKFVIKNGDDDSIVGTSVQTLNDLIDRTQIDKKSIPLKDAKGELTITTHWKPVSLDVGTTSIAYTPPIGVVRVFVEKATNLKNLEKIGKIDPYAKVLVNGISKGRTDTQPQTLNPVWEQAIYVAVTSSNQRITIECMDVETVNKDRSVGKFDLKIQDLFHKDENDRYAINIDDKSRVGPLVRKKGSQGNITYKVSFYPTMPVLTLEELQDVEKIQSRKKKIEDRKKTVDEKKLSTDEKRKLQQEETEIKDIGRNVFRQGKVGILTNQLTNYNAGVLSISVLDGELPQTGLYVQAFFDANGHPRFVSPQISSRIIRTGWTGDVMIKELQDSVTTFKVTKKKFSNKVDNSICQVSISTIDLVKECYYKPSIIDISGESNAKIMVQVSWFPIDVDELPQADLKSNSGELTILAKSAENLISADTNGYSDPFIKFYINDEDDPRWKTKIVKKTLNPTWNDSGTIEIHNRMHDRLILKVMDWDAASGDDTIGWGSVPLSKVDPEGTTSLDVKIKGVNGEDGGVAHLEFTYSSRYITGVTKREAKVGDIASKGIGSGLKAGQTVVSTGLGTVGKIGRGIFGGKKNKHNNNYKSDEEREDEEEE
ncbi:tricalbin NDAI_0B04030 [Naumovozyma dairenensis CBS 421]|uniref:Tricalbin n=1 Tax=Naumovozyma dairenensis (strain ATCC 10597 / BCRC 20456 / CBS 421 / NBRC 0211 / NRRL Y-12639) TaxID=1071378 RepID=G0W6M6_NAUDC|nr:hypothetical protein NDAI_0B04030 [Naumovozyma dairenensis CBS 421]CCD23437.1 hypothetical protein NDAI_0B04030 [Naumovozyma dairenensis CBS 421]